MRKIILLLFGEMPSKKNSWKRSESGQVFIPSGVQKEIDAFLWQIKGTKNRPREPMEGNLRVWLDFYVKSVARRDLDNMATTALDILQKAGVIKNDKDVVQLVCLKQQSNKPRVAITITKQA